MDQSSAPSNSLGTPPPGGDNLSSLPYDDELEMGMEADDEDDGRKPAPESNQSGIDPKNPCPEVHSAT